MSCLRFAEREAWHLTEQRRITCILERAHHPGHVSNSKALPTPLLQRSRRLAFEIDDHEFAACIENLAKMIIAVKADAYCGDRLSAQRTKAFCHLMLSIEQLACVLSGLPFERALLPAQESERDIRLAQHLLIQGLTLGRAERLGCEVGSAVRVGK